MSLSKLANRWVRHLSILEITPLIVFVLARFYDIDITHRIYIGGGVSMLVFGFFKGSIIVLILFGLIGFGIQGGFIGMYAIAARLYPTQVRTTGVGWAIGLGRLGAVVGPIIGGLLIGAGFSMATNFMFFAIPTIISGIAILFIKND